MENKISLEASGMPGVIETMEKHFGKLIKEASTIKTVSASVIVGAECNHVVGVSDDFTWNVDDGCSHDVPVELADFQRDDFKDNWPKFRDTFRAYNFCPLCGISLTAIIQDFLAKREKEIAGPPDKGRERKPCKTCGADTGYLWAERPEGAVIWCINTDCADFHTVFTSEEWGAR